MALGLSRALSVSEACMEVNRVKVEKKKVIKKKDSSLEEKRGIFFKDKLKRVIDSFNRNHFVYEYCFPRGRKLNNQGQEVGNFQRKSIYICENLCRNKCRDFDRKIYICKDLSCKEWPICLYYSEIKMKKHCKKMGFYKERKNLIPLYEKYLLYMKLYRGLKKSPVRTLRYIDKLKKEGRLGSGKVQNKRNSKKGKVDRAGKRGKNKTGSKK